ncbi:MAG: hypothetical protein HQM11_08005, partial [SAR324 cluster bacterium]|nr:hypothetical protein [SAR324 cluster bacterium]
MADLSASMVCNSAGNSSQFLAELKKYIHACSKSNVIAPNVKVRKGGEEFEIDVMAYANTDVNAVYLVEVKSHLRDDGIDQLLENMRQFHRFFPEHQDKKVYGILAGVDVSR